MKKVAASARFGQVIFATAFASIVGTAIITFGSALLLVVNTGQLSSLVFALFSFAVGAVIAIFTAFPIGVVSGLIIYYVAGAGYWQLALNGAVTGCGLALLLAQGADPDSSAITSPLVAGLTTFVPVGVISGTVGWWAANRKQ